MYDWYKPSQNHTINSEKLFELAFQAGKQGRPQEELKDLISLSKDLFEEDIKRYNKHLELQQRMHHITLKFTPVRETSPPSPSPTPLVVEPPTPTPRSDAMNAEIPQREVPPILTVTVLPPVHTHTQVFAPVPQRLLPASDRRILPRTDARELLRDDNPEESDEVGDEDVPRKRGRGTGKLWSKRATKDLIILAARKPRNWTTVCDTLVGMGHPTRDIKAVRMKYYMLCKKDSTLPK